MSASRTTFRQQPVVDIEPRMPPAPGWHGQWPGTMNLMDCPLAETSGRSSSTEQHRTDQLVVVAQVDRHDSARAIGVEVGQRTFHQPVASGQHQVEGVGVAANLDDLGVRSSGWKANRLATARLAPSGGLGQVVGLGPINPSLGGEEQDQIVWAHEGCRDDVIPCFNPTPTPCRRVSCDTDRSWCAGVSRFGDSEQRQSSRAIKSSSLTSPSATR